jgi:hypothetical protein
VNPGQEERLVRIDVSYSRDDTLVQKKAFDWRGPSSQRFSQIAARKAC